MFLGDAPDGDRPEYINFLRQWVFWLVHIVCIAVFFVGFSWIAVGVCFFFYFIRMFLITGWYHRYFSHRSFKTSRWFQFLMALFGTTCAQKGPIWWASHHRHHHRHSDTPEDQHSPIIHGIYYAHVGWVLSSNFVHTRVEQVKDLMQFPELRWLERYNLVPPMLLAVGMYFLGVVLQNAYPGLNTSGFQMLIWGFFISTVLLYHGTFSINSFAHVMGKQRFKTGEHSKNSFLLAMITLGEGWHNNHHRYPGSEQQGFYWWEIDISHYMLKIMSWFGLVWDLRKPPKRIYEEAKAA